VATLLVDGRPVAPCVVARSFRDRSRGLLGRDGLEGALLLDPGSSVHTFRMRFAIDVAFCDRAGRVLDTVTMARNRLGRPRIRAKRIVEAEAGAFERWGLRPGVTVTVDEDADPHPPVLAYLTDGFRPSGTQEPRGLTEGRRHRCRRHG
jgi:uncharacterized protein